MMKKTLGWLHLWLGIVSGLVVLVVALTGSILVFEDELEHLFRPSLYYVQVPAQGEKIPVSMLAADVKKSYPDYKLNSIIIEPEANRTIIFTVLKGKNVKSGKLIAMAINPYTGQIIKAVDEKSRFFTVVLRLHRYLCMGETGKVITGISCSIFVILIISGLVLWWPKRNNRKQRFRVKWNASFKRLNWDLHAVFGFYVHIILLFIALTGLVWSYKWVNNLIYYSFDGSLKAIKAKVPQSEPVKDSSLAYLDKILTATNERLTYPGTATIRFGEDSLAMSVIKENTTASIDNVSDFLYFQKGSGKLIQERLYDNESTGTKARRIIYPIHTGRLYGWPTKILAFIASLTAATLPVSGLIIYLGRKKKKKKPASLKKHVNARVQYQ